VGDLDERNRGAGAYSTPGVDPPYKPGEFVPRSSRPQVGFELEHVTPPSNVYVRQEECLNVACTNSDPNVSSFTVRGRLLRASDGKVIQFETTALIGSASIPTGVVVRMVEGYLLGVQVVPNTNPRRGRFYASVSLSFDSPTTPSIQNLIADYFSFTHAPTWPGGEYISPVESAGWSQSLQVGNPAAGADWSTTVPTHQRWRLQSIVATLVTAVAVANRIPTFIIDDGVNILWQVDAIVAEVASTTKVYALAPGQTAAAGAGNTVSLPLPGPQFLTPGWRVRASTAAIQAADQWSAISLNIETWVDS